MFTKRRLAAKYCHSNLVVVAGFLLLSQALVGQSPQASSRRPVLTADQKAASEAMTKLKAGQLDPFDERVLARTGMVEAVPDLEKKFANTTDTLEKASLAEALVELGDTNAIYWDFLANSVEQALSLGEPDLFDYDAQGKLIPGPSLGLRAWAKAKGLDETAAERDAMRTHPTEVLFLALTGDDRAIPLLRRALASRNYFVEGQAARGLATLGDSFSVPLIIHAASLAPAQAAEFIAQSLVYFDNSDAQQALDLYVPKEQAQSLRQARAKGEGLISPKK